MYPFLLDRQRVLGFVPKAGQPEFVGQTAFVRGEKPSIKGCRDVRTSKAERYALPDRGSGGSHWKLDQV